MTASPPPEARWTFKVISALTVRVETFRLVAAGSASAPSAILRSRRPNPESTRPAKGKVPGSEASFFSWRNHLHPSDFRIPDPAGIAGLSIWTSDRRHREQNDRPEASKVSMLPP